MTISRVLSAAIETAELNEKRKSLASLHRRAADKTLPKQNTESALLRVSVITGLQLVFSLLRNSAREDTDDLVSDTLDVARDTLQNLPTLSLAPSTSLSPLAIDCLNKTENFLQKWISAKTQISQKAAEVLLSLSVQRGTLRHLLSFISSCLEFKTPISGVTLRNII